MNDHFIKFSRRNQHRNLWDSSSDDDDSLSSSNNPIPSSLLHLFNSDNQNNDRLTLLAAFPSLHQNGIVVYRGYEHLLLANIPRMFFFSFLLSFI